jgi:hypothetical protein
MIDINREDLYRYKKSKKVTKERLEELSDLGMEEIGVAEFGIKGIMSGLYLERVWCLSNKQWRDYIDWIKELIKRKKK